MCRDAILSINKVFLWYCFWISPVRRENHFAICFATNWKYAHVFAHIPFLCLAPGNISAIFSTTTLLVYQMKDCGHIYSLKVYLSYKKKSRLLPVVVTSHFDWKMRVIAVHTGSKLTLCWTLVMTAVGLFGELVCYWSLNWSRYTYHSSSP